MIQIRRVLLLFFLLTLSFSLNSARAVAQDGPEEESPELDDSIVVEEVFVTGSLLPKGDFVSKAPIATITSSQFEMSNAVNVENLINSMPQVVGGADRSSSFGQGIATANLRGLGENRTLVLINSRRFVPTFPDGGTVDLNFIPVGLIDRVEILTGGASTAYGSDALAGVINFILKEETDGWEFNGGVEITERGDSEIYNFNLTNGGTFANGRGKYLAHGDFLERKPLYFTDRGLTDSPLIDAPDGSGVINAPNRFPITPNASMFIPNFTVPGGPSGFFGVFDNDGNLNLNSGEGEFFGSDAFGIPQGTDLDSINGFSYLQLPQERKSFKGKVSYDFGKVEAYADVYYSKSEVPFQWGGPLIGFPTTTGYTATIENNPFMTEEAKQFISANYFEYGRFLPQRVQYRDDNNNGIADTVRLPFFFRMFTRDIGITKNPRTFESQQFEFGLKGSLGSNWGYEIFAQLGEVETILDPGPLLNPERIQQGLLLTEDGTQCQDQSNGCVPVNLWSDDIGPEAAAFITYPDGAGRSVTNNEQNVIMGTISGNTGDWFSLPGDPGPIGLVVGFEYLEINSKIDTPAFIEQQLFEGFSNSPFSLDADVDTFSLFGEAVVPLVAGKPGIDFLELELGWRVAEHSITGNASSFKTALSYYPTADVQLRASFNKAIRSPAIDELYRDQQNEFNGIDDPCTNPNPVKGVGFGGAQFVEIERSSELDAACLSTGIPEANLYDPLLKEVSGVEDLGGNSNLVNEDAQTLSVGFVWTPYSIDGLSMSLDYFQVEIEEYISTTPISAPELMINCFDTARGVGGAGSAACESIGRDTDGRLNRIFRGYRNLGFHEVRGWDLNVDYGFSLLSGYVDLNYFATKIDERSIVDSTFGDVNFECVGQFNGACDNLISYPVFDFKHRMTAGWSKGDLDLQLVWRYNAALDDGNEQVQYYREKLSSYSLFDFSGRYQINDNFALTVGIRNIADKQPEPIGTNSWEYTSVANQVPAVSNTYTQYYDVYGRTAFMKLTAIF